MTRLDAEGEKLTVKISGLMGGHSGAEIDKNRANANSLLGKFLHGLDEKTDFELISVQGGQKDNAITREATAEILVLEEKYRCCQRICGFCAGSMERRVCRN